MIFYKQMISYKRIGILLSVGLLAVSCIRREALNAEADIETCSVPEGMLIAPPTITNDRITLMMSPAANLTQVPLEFTLSSGATIEPASGTVQNFSVNRSCTYKVTSQDGQWTKEYEVTAIVDGILSSYSFENYRLSKNGKYYEFYELGAGNDTMAIWASGNPGFQIVASQATPEEYPTVTDSAGVVGRCAKLETRSTGKAGAIFKMPLAAGNLYLGNFKLNITNGLKSTLFGIPYTSVPTGIKGYYKYKAGDQYTDKSGAVIENMRDTMDIYGVMFETDDKVTNLDGSNVLTHPNLVAIARMAPEEKKETDEWTFFSIPFKLLDGKTIDPEKLKNNQYSISVVFSSSKDGAAFSGAVGSTLYVDEVELINLNNE